MSDKEAEVKGKWSVNWESLSSGVWFGLIFGFCWGYGRNPSANSIIVMAVFTSLVGFGSLLIELTIRGITKRNETASRVLRKIKTFGF